MYTSEQVKAYLTHTDPIVSNGAIQYFAESFNYTDGIMELVLDKLGSSGQPDQVYLHLAYQFPQTPSTVARMADLLTSSALKGTSRLHLQQILLNSPPALLEPVLPKLQGLQDETGVKAEEHIRIGQLSAEELRETLQQMIEASSGLEYEDLEYDYLDDLINEAVRRQALTPEFVLEKLDQADPGDTSNYESVYYAQAAGKLKLETAVPVLIDYLFSTNDLLAEQACDALVRIGTEKVVNQLAERYAKEQDDYFKLYAADCLGRISHPAAESAVLALLQKERNLTHATKLAAALCFMGSKQSIPVVARLIEAGYDDDYLDLREPLYICCILNETELPQLAEWRESFL
ncbi:HEAT repeat domain-containing protein [Paenibacillus pinistramenti]|uniref:HEAT repeat domain-containing protein n=1 Tax=Paenibacillus pinistramenti TaxID=1768003 RepID=UPI001107B4E9|nr:HEAT repeat domain-containing protein [Paenibacillus pinistramenti]